VDFTVLALIAAAVIAAVLAVVAPSRARAFSASSRLIASLVVVINAILGLCRKSAPRRR